MLVKLRLSLYPNPHFPCASRKAKKCAGRRCHKVSIRFTLMNSRTKCVRKCTQRQMHCSLTQNNKRIETQFFTNHAVKIYFDNLFFLLHNKKVHPKQMGIPSCYDLLLIYLSQQVTTIYE
jgi:hypothetical protein